MVGSVNSIAMSAMSRISMGIEEHSPDFGVAALNVANGFSNQDNPIGFSRLGPNNAEGPAFTDMSSMGGLSGFAAISSQMVNAIQSVNTDTAYTDNSFLDEIKSITMARGLFESAMEGSSDDAVSAADMAVIAVLSAGSGAVGGEGSATASAAISAIGDTSTIGTSSSMKSASDTQSESSGEVTTQSYVKEPITSSGGQGSGEALSGLGGSSAQSGDAQQSVMVEKLADLNQRIPNGESRAESEVGLAQTTQSFRQMEAYTKLQDDIEITHAKALSQILMDV